jgi:hypothetical protein
MMARTMNTEEIKYAHTIDCLFCVVKENRKKGIIYYKLIKDKKKNASLSR